MNYDKVLRWFSLILGLIMLSYGLYQSANGQPNSAIDILVGVILLLSNAIVIWKSRK